ncbi:MAG: hypothetical protein ACYTG1_00345 [Planctomycetota bacterium]|jgi:hypothetical protein
MDVATDGTADRPERGVEILMTRIIDGEASIDDQRDFERHADGEPSWWRRLALRQLDMVALAGAVEPTLERAAGVELPAAAPRGRLAPALAFTGWAAVLCLAVGWGLSALSGPGAPAPVMQPMSSSPAAAPMDPDELLRRYKQAPFVLDELDPILLEAEALSDGRTALHFVRRIEEVAFIDDAETAPVDDTGRFLVDPAMLRRDAGTPPTTD